MLQQNYDESLKVKNLEKLDYRVKIKSEMDIPEFNDQNQQIRQENEIRVYFPSTEKNYRQRMNLQNLNVNLQKKKNGVQDQGGNQPWKENTAVLTPNNNARRKLEKVGQRSIMSSQQGKNYQIYDGFDQKGNLGPRIKGFLKSENNYQMILPVKKGQIDFDKFLFSKTQKNFLVQNQNKDEKEKEKEQEFNSLITILSNQEGEQQENSFQIKQIQIQNPNQVFDQNQVEKFHQKVSLNQKKILQSPQRQNQEQRESFLRQARQDEKRNQSRNLNLNSLMNNQKKGISNELEEFKNQNIEELEAFYQKCNNNTKLSWQNDWISNNDIDLEEIVSREKQQKENQQKTQSSVQTNQQFQNQQTNFQQNQKNQNLAKIENFYGSLNKLSNNINKNNQLREDLNICTNSQKLVELSTLRDSQFSKRSQLINSEENSLILSQNQNKNILKIRKAQTQMEENQEPEEIQNFLEFKKQHEIPGIKNFKINKKINLSYTNSNSHPEFKQINAYLIEDQNILNQLKQNNNQSNNSSEFLLSPTNQGSQNKKSIVKVEFLNGLVKNSQIELFQVVVPNQNTFQNKDYQLTSYKQIIKNLILNKQELLQACHQTKINSSKKEFQFVYDCKLQEIEEFSNLFISKSNKKNFLIVSCFKLSPQEQESTQTLLEQTEQKQNQIQNKKKNFIFGRQIQSSTIQESEYMQKEQFQKQKKDLYEQKQKMGESVSLEKAKNMAKLKNTIYFQPYQKFQKKINSNNISIEVNENLKNNSNGNLMNENRIKTEHQTQEDKKVSKNMNIFEFYLNQQGSELGQQIVQDRMTIFNQTRYQSNRSPVANKFLSTQYNKNMSAEKKYQNQNSYLFQQGQINQSPQNQNQLVLKNLASNVLFQKPVSLIQDHKTQKEILKIFQQKFQIPQLRNISECLFFDSFQNINKEDIESNFSEFLYLCQIYNNFLTSPLNEEINKLPQRQKIHFLFSSEMKISFSLLQEYFPLLKKIKQNILQAIQKTIDLFFDENNQKLESNNQNNQIEQLNTVYWSNFIKFKQCFIEQIWNKEEKINFISFCINPQQNTMISFTQMNEFLNPLSKKRPIIVSRFISFLNQESLNGTQLIQFQKIIEVLSKETFLGLKEIISSLLQI